MWGRFWTGIYGFVIPYPDAPSVDVTDELVAQGYNSTTLFELSDDFFASLGLMRMNDGFWKNSVRVSNTCTVWATLNVRFLTNQRGKSVVSSQKSYIYRFPSGTIVNIVKCLFKQRRFYQSFFEKVVEKGV